jgi:hypothetical protein
MALPFKNIGKRINDFLKPKEYKLNRTAKINVSSDKVNWSLENKLNGNGAIESELEVSHQFDQETLKLITSTIKAPKFEVKTKRIQSKFDVKASVQDPKLEINLCQKREKYALCIDSTYDWSNQNCDGEVAISYAGIDRMLLGAKAKVERSQKQQTLGVTDYNVGLQWNRNEDQTFAVTTENQLQKIKAGAEFKVRDNYRGFAQISYNTGAEEKDNGPLGYSVGIRREMTNTSHIRGVFRSDQTASVLYANNFTDSNVCAKIGANFDFTKEPSRRASVEWKVVFGCGDSKSCCK